MMKSRLCFSQVFAEVRRKEGCRLVMLGKKVVGKTESVEGSALAIPEAHDSRKSFHNHRTRDNTGRNCEHRGKPNHTQETCYKLHGKPQNDRKRNLLLLQQMRRGHLHSIKNN